MPLSTFEINSIGLPHQEQEHKKSEQYPFRMHGIFSACIDCCSQRIWTNYQHQVCKPLHLYFRNELIYTTSVETRAY